MAKEINNNKIIEKIEEIEREIKEIKKELKKLDFVLIYDYYYNNNSWGYSYNTED